MATQSADNPTWHPRGTLVSDALGRSLQRSMWIGGLLGELVAIAVAVLLRDRGFATVVVAAVAGTIAGMSVVFLVMPPRDRRAFETFAWLGRRELDRIEARTGRRFSGTPRAASDWLETHPRSPATAAARVEVLAMLGRFPEAEAEAAALPSPADDLEAVTQALNRQQLAFIARGVVEVTGLDALEARLVPMSDAALELRVGRAIGIARGRLAGDGRDWSQPLLEVRPALGREATWVLVRDIWSRIALAVFAIGLLLAAIVVFP